MISSLTNSSIQLYCRGMKKLVRDLIPTIMAQQGGSCRFHEAAEAEYRDFLKDKLLEEAREFMNDETIEELADLLEVIETIGAVYGFRWEDIVTVKEQKRLAKGSFSKRIILEL